ncbi:MAG: hypothetical protein H5T65_08220 [Chloroflexi bacterium]|nr:hypothetical protein [Chloroflexota bacterium]
MGERALSHARLAWALALVVAAALAVLVWAGLGVGAQGGFEVWVCVPSPAEVRAGGGEITATVVITAAELYGYQFVLTFDPTMLEAVDAGFEAGFLNPEYTPVGWSGTIDNVAGTVRFAATQLKPTPPAAGSGAVAWVRFRAKSPSPVPVLTQIGLENVKLATADGDRLEPVALSPALVTIVPFTAIEVRVPPPGEIMESDRAITATLVLTCENVYGYQFAVTFDPTLLEATAAGFDDSFVLPDYSPPGWAATVDNVAGTVRFAATQFKPAPPATGAGAIGWVRFVAKSPPVLPITATVGIADPRLGSADGLRVTPDVISGYIRILPMSVITGQVELQGRTDWSGAVAAAWPAGVMTTTDTSGFYTLTVPTDTYTVTVEMTRYLDGERVEALVRGENPLPRVRLLGGDANDDDEVDIVDMSIIGGKYDLTVDPLTERADINADGVVDIVDMVLAAGNYTRTSPVPWP